MRLIDVNKLKEVLFPEDASGGFWGYGTLEEILDQQLTINAEPVRHGEWELNEDGKWACSYCEGLAVKHPDEPEKWQALTTYCPNCGAKMEGE